MVYALLCIINTHRKPPSPTKRENFFNHFRFYKFQVPEEDRKAEREKLKRMECCYRIMVMFQEKHVRLFLKTRTCLFVYSLFIKIAGNLQV